jgi:hypothetical protein
MIQLILKNNLEQNKLDALISFLKSWNIDAEFKSVVNEKEIKNVLNPVKKITPKTKPSDYIGIFNTKDTISFENHIQQTRSEWSRDS